MMFRTQIAINLYGRPSLLPQSTLPLESSDFSNSSMENVAHVLCWSHSAVSRFCIKNYHLKYLEHINRRQCPSAYYVAKGFSLSI